MVKLREASIPCPPPNLAEVGLVAGTFKTRAWLIISREQCLSYGSGFAVATADVMMGHVYGAVPVFVLVVQ